ncbi:MAG: hypothetical protein JWM11_1912 [Planctomycetaceae bacterium]|nr:hypothetical protein [Planctomycetaceae bacterium]
MSDPLARICSLNELSSEDRQRLLSELDYMAQVFSVIDRGAGFCEDRGFGWTAEMERAEGTDRIFARLREWPILRRLMPRIRHLRHETSPVIGTNSTPMDDVLVAQLLLRNTRSFSGRYGEGWGERSVQVSLEPDAIQVNEETFATALNGQPFDESEYSADYSINRDNSFWRGLREKLDAETWRQASALAGRMGQAIFPCDQCGQVSQTLSLAGTVLIYDGPVSAPASLETAPEIRSALRQAMAELDMLAIRAIDPKWTEGYNAASDASYCQKHIQ